MEYKIKIQRKGPEGKPEWKEYPVPVEPGMSVLNVLMWIRDHLEPGLAFYSSCRMGLCTGCLVKVNGKQVFACATPAEDGMKLEPPPRLKHLRDLYAEIKSRGAV